MLHRSILALYSDNHDCLPQLPQEEADAIFADAQAALDELRDFNLNRYRPPRLVPAEQMNPGEQQARRLAERLAWGWRVADSFDNIRLAEDIFHAIEPHNGFAYLVAYTFLSETFETEKGLQPLGYWINPLSSAAKQRILALLLRHIAGTPSAVELRWLYLVLNRAILWLPYSRQPETYIDLSETEPIFTTLEERVDDVLLADHNSLLAVEEIRRCQQIIQRYLKKSEQTGSYQAP
jgi:hypothetical protein